MSSICLFFLVFSILEWISGNHISKRRRKKGFTFKLQTMRKGQVPAHWGLYCSFSVRPLDKKWLPTFRLPPAFSWGAWRRPGASKGASRVRRATIGGSRAEEMDRKKLRQGSMGMSNGTLSKCNVQSQTLSSSEQPPDIASDWDETRLHISLGADF